jgi:pimeloyl-ACP methyl ester carboxylesterase
MMPDMPVQEPKTIATELGDVEYIEAGTGDPVLFVHGSPGGCDQGSIMSAFLVAAGMRAVAPSRVGYLGTPLGADGSIDHQADLHAALMTALGVDRFAVVCWSGGGPSSYRLAVRHPGRVRALVAQAAVSRRFDWHLGADDRLMLGTSAGNWLVRAMADHAPKQFISATLGAEGDLTKAQLAELTEQVYDDPVKRAFVLELGHTVSFRGPRKKGMSNDERLFPAIEDLELPRISAPTLLVHGAVDTDVAPSYSSFAAGQIPGAELLTVDAGTHLAVYTAGDSDRVQGRILEFLAGH